MAISKVVLGLALSLSLSCASSSPTFAQLVKHASSRWELATCRTPRYEVIITLPSIPQCGTIIDAWGCYYQGTISLSAKVPADKRMQVLVHEMGHSLAPSAPHVADKTGVMASSIAESTTYITMEDIRTRCKEYDCPCQRPEDPSP